MTTTNPPVNPLILELLAWIDRQPRTYAQAMEAWRSTCPRQTVWDDASIAGLIRVNSGRNQTMSESQISLTPLGRTLLNADVESRQHNTSDSPQA